MEINEKLWSTAKIVQLKDKRWNWGKRLSVLMIILGFQVYIEEEKIVTKKCWILYYDVSILSVFEGQLVPIYYKDTFNVTEKFTYIVSILKFIHRKVIKVETKWEQNKIFAASTLHCFHIKTFFTQNKSFSEILHTFKFVDFKFNVNSILSKLQKIFASI